jgi:hypothetical protein
MTSEDIRKLLEAATPGPWRDGQEGNKVLVYGPNGMTEHSGLIANVFKRRSNARLIAAAPDLAAEVLRLHEQAAFRDEADTLMAHTRNAELDALRSELAAKDLELAEWRTWGVIEVMIRNPNVDSFVREKEAEIAALRAKLEGE